MHRAAQLLLSALTLTLAACSSQATSPAPAVETTSVHPVSGLEVIPLTITQNGKAHAFRVEVAQTERRAGARG